MIGEEILEHGGAVLLLEAAKGNLRYAMQIIDQPGLSLAVRLIERAIEREREAMASQDGGS